MRFLLRSLFVWLLALALPLQGIAATGMQACGGMHGGPGPMAAAADVTVHGHARADAHHAHAERSSVSAHALADQDQDQELPAAGHQCGACAACCPAVALPSEVAFPAASGKAADVIAAAPAHVVSFVPPGLERPPRNLLA